MTMGTPEFSSARIADRGRGPYRGLIQRGMVVAAMVALLTVPLARAQAPSNDDARPIAVNDRFVVEQGKELVVPAPGLLVNDFDPLGQPFTIAIFYAGETELDGLYGDIIRPLFMTSYSLGGVGDLYYEPLPNFVGTDALSYRIETQDGRTSEPALVIIDVIPPLHTVATPGVASGVLGSESCTVEPVDLETELMLVATGATPAAAAGADADSGAVSTLSQGEPADDATRAEVERVVIEYVACTNVGAMHRVLSLLSTDFRHSVLRENYLGGETNPVVIEVIASSLVDIEATRVAETETDPGRQRLTFDGLGEVVVLADGRVQAEVLGVVTSFSLVEFVYRFPGGPAIITFVPEGDELRIDSVVPIGS